MKRLLARALPPALRGRVGAALRRLDPEHAAVAHAFDAAFYLRTNRDVAAAGHDPLDHFMRFGWREGRDPSPDFSVAAYLRAHPEVAEAGTNPFTHFLASGRAFAAPPESPLGFRYEVIERLTPVDRRIPPAPAPPIRDFAELAQALRAAPGGLSQVHLTFSHDDFTAHVGGLQTAIRREAARLAELGRDHLHLHPARAWPLVRTGDEIEPLGVVLNGVRVGVFAAADVAQAIAAATGGEGAGRSFAIHSLLGHAVGEVHAILAAAGLRRGVFWLHDFASLCAGFHLLRNDVEDCAAPPPESAACGICLYGPWRARHLAEHRRLAEGLELTVAAPSQSALDLWRRTAPFAPARTVVLPHTTLEPRGPAPVTESGPFKLAFAGLPTAHKGWPVFRALALRFADDPRYAFLHLGARTEPGLPVTFQEVASGMQAALTAAAPDAVLVWPLCRETFSFVAYEAVAAGCAVITGPDSGNVAAFVADGEHGRVYDHETALADALESGAVLDLARARRRPLLHDLRDSALSLDLPA